jgi:Cytidylate kinase-like family
MGIWTISAQTGTGGRETAAALAAAAGVPLLDRAALAQRLDDDLGDVERLEERVGGRLNLVALGMAMCGGANEAYRELKLRETLPQIGRAVADAAAREPCVILAPAAFAALAGNDHAVNVRLWAPLERRVEAYAREQLLDRKAAEKAVRRCDHLQRHWVHSLYHVDPDETRHFALVLDTSRFSTERLVEIMLASGGRRRQQDNGGVARVAEQRLDLGPGGVESLDPSPERV